MRFCRLLLILTTLVLAAVAAAQPYIIERFSFTGELKANGQMDVQERIEVIFNESRRGIFRDIPIHYDTGKGTTRDIYLTNISVTDEHGNPLTTKLTSKGRYRDIRIGDEAIFFPPGMRKIYNIKYTADGMINWFDAAKDWEPYAELYWGITGEEWDTEISRVDFRIKFPKSEGGKGLRARLIFGPYGSRLSHDVLQLKENSYDATTGTVLTLKEDEVSGGRNVPMPSMNGLTVVLNMPAHLIAKPTLGQQAVRLLLPNLGFTIPLLVLGFMGLMWFMHGRDPDGGVMVVQFDPPDGIGGPELGALLDETVDQRDLAAGIISLAVKGHLKIIPKEEGLFFKKRSADLEMNPNKPKVDLTPFEDKLLDLLLTGGNLVDESDLRTNVAPHVQDLRNKIYGELVQKGYYRTSPEAARANWGCLGIVGVIVLGLLFTWISPFGSPFPAIVGGVVGAVLVFFFARGMPRRTDAGAKAHARAKGFEEFVRRARKHELEWMSQKHPDAVLFETYLPHAVAMGLTREWAQAFEGIVQQMPSWYVSPYGGHFHPMYFGNDLVSISDSMGAAAAVPPRSSGGGGGSSGFSSGGGFSGGGFGGGGGGSW